MCNVSWHIHDPVKSYNKEPYLILFNSTFLKFVTYETDFLPNNKLVSHK